MCAVRWMKLGGLLVGIVWLAAPAIWAQDAAEAEIKVEAADAPQALTVEELTKRAGKSVAVIEVTDRSGRRQSIGSGFVIAPQGLIATNLHVIGEARPISVEFADGRKFQVKSIHASDRGLDLAVLKIDADGLTPLELGDSDELEQGQEIVALGHPQGLQHSVVAGIVSGRRTNDGVPMIQLAMPIETGNSGGPVLDRFGRVHGIVTLKSAVTANLGFAVAINSLKPLLAKPNPVSMDTWRRIGAIDEREWKILHGASWRRRAGRILVDGDGAGIGRRSLCLWQAELPEVPYEIAVRVRLGEESGAAGLVFFSDGEDRHYGFYPSNGNLRLGRFDGPDVYSWHVLEQIDTPAYKPGEWNHLKIRIEKDRVLCFVNEHLVAESADRRYREGRPGMVQFRGTPAQFRGFQVAKSIPSTLPSAETAANVVNATDGLDPRRPVQPEVVRSLAEAGPLAPLALQNRADDLEQRAAKLRELATAVRVKRIQSELVSLFEQPEEEIDLIHAALLLAQLDQDDLDVNAYREEVDRMSRGLRPAEPDADESPEDKLQRLNAHFFKTLGFHGSRIDYYSRANSYLNEVIDDRKGLPITLSILYMELGRRMGLEINGLGLPGHFIVRAETSKDGPGTLIDVFDDGQEWSIERARLQVQAAAEREFTDDDLRPTPRRAIIVRMLHNLFGVANSERDPPAMLRYVDTIVALDPDAEEPGTAADRMYRAALFLQTERVVEAREDVDWLLRTQTDDELLERVRRLQTAIDAAER